MAAPHVLARWLTALVVAGLVAACSITGAPPSSTPAAADPSSPPTAPPTGSPPAPTGSPPAPTAEPTPTAGATAAADDPPEGLLGTGTATVAGWLGTYCWTDTCVDVMQTAPKSELPSLVVASLQSELTFALSGGLPFYEWSASYAAGSNGAVTVLGSGGDFLDPDSNESQPPLLDEARFVSPPSGDWVVHVFASFAEGDASYAWHVTVP